ncbi:hypothetical protein DERP_008940 [Dermatophagoides pteronyssinus]|uniref:Uncharacterized protein n=1 Tax=Dermatophagoides pteronyssinus TaxID=6956 RepID=A0ABQ8JNT3_DERPT|nr:hypothetical protein DERP_008940 [Dermatophagoides pteronyssinus]
MKTNIILLSLLKSHVFALKEENHKLNENEKKVLEKKLSRIKKEMTLEIRSKIITLHSYMIDLICDCPKFKI